MNHLTPYSLFESASGVKYQIDYDTSDGSVKVYAKIKSKTVGILSIKDDSDLEYDSFDIISAVVLEQYRRTGIYIGMIKYFLEHNTLNVNYLISQKNPDFDEQPRTGDADLFWKHVHKNQKRYGVVVSKTGMDYEISLAEKILESFEDNFVGIHCSPRSLNDDDFYGKIIDEYYMAFPQILELVKHDYPEAKEFLDRIESLEDGLSMDNDSADLIYEIEAFFSDNDLEWIFVSKGEAMTKYGENCYEVYFRDLSNVYSMEDELTDNAMIYIYNSKTDRPILKRNDI